MAGIIFTKYMELDDEKFRDYLEFCIACSYTKGFLAEPSKADKNKARKIVKWMREHKSELSLLEMKLDKWIDEIKSDESNPENKVTE